MADVDLWIMNAARAITADDEDPQKFHDVLKAAKTAADRRSARRFRAVAKRLCWCLYAGFDDNEAVNDLSSCRDRVTGKLMFPDMRKSYAALWIKNLRKRGFLIPSTLADPGEPAALDRDGYVHPTWPDDPKRIGSFVDLARAKDKTAAVALTTGKQQQFPLRPLLPYCEVIDDAD